MGEPDDPSLFRSVKSKAKALGLRHKSDKEPVLPITNGTSPPTTSLDEVVSEKPSHNDVAHKHKHK
jgi:Ca2+:H+ antiporter